MKTDVIGTADASGPPTGVGTRGAGAGRRTQTGAAGRETGIATCGIAVASDGAGRQIEPEIGTRTETGTGADIETTENGAESAIAGGKVKGEEGGGEAATEDTARDALENVGCGNKD